MVDRCIMSGVCCKLFSINLNEEEYHSKKFETELGEHGHFENFEEAEACGANILKRKVDGSCVYLKDNMCSIHETRPQVCRGFFCNSKKEEYQDMIKQVNKVKKEKGLEILE